MVDENGNLVWTVDDTDHANMEYSIPTNLTVIDTDNNGVSDRVYFGDLGGQMWRVDFDDVTLASDTHVSLFADVTNATGHKPLFYAPSVSLNRENGERFLSVTFGSGDRTQPLQPDSENAFYMLRDVDYKVGPPIINPSTTIRPPQIMDLTDNQIGSDNESVRENAKAELATKSGWLVKLNPGEKSLSEVVTFEGKFLATTFEPAAAVDEHGELDECSFAMIGRLYVMNLLDARPIEILADGSEKTNGLDKAKRITQLNGTSIPSAPVVVFPADSSQVQIIVDKESVTSINRELKTVFWHAK